MPERTDIPFITTDQMREVDRLMIDEYHIGLEQMMENAGRNLARLAVDRFLNGDIRYVEIADIVDAVLQEHTPPDSVELDDIREADRKARSHASALTFSKA